jgi:transcriptional regulator with XRE-family HTH domain
MSIVYAEEWGAALQQCREDYGDTLKQAAEYSDMHWRSIKRIESGKATITAVEKLCRYYEIDPAEPLGFGPGREPVSLRIRGAAEKAWRMPMSTDEYSRAVGAIGTKRLQQLAKGEGDLSMFDAGALAYAFGGWSNVLSPWAPQ